MKKLNTSFSHCTFGHYISNYFTNMITVTVDNFLAWFCWHKHRPVSTINLKKKFSSVMQIFPPVFVKNFWSLRLYPYSIFHMPRHQTWNPVLSTYSHFLHISKVLILKIAYLLHKLKKRTLLHNLGLFLPDTLCHQSNIYR